jgi:RNA polymerase sigma-70 factor (ECF subfamily)
MRQGLDALYREHSAALTRYAMRHVGGDGAEDIVATTFALAHSKLPPDHPQPAGWLFRTARFLMKAEIRRSERERRALRDAAVIAGPDDAANDVEVIRELLEALPVKHREVLQLTYWDLLSASEVGVVMGCSEAAAWKRISRAKAALRAAWDALDATAWKEMLTIDQA